MIATAAENEESAFEKAYNGLQGWVDEDVYTVALMVKVLDEDALDGKMWKYVESPAHEMDESGFDEFDSSFEQMEEGYKYTQELFYIYSRSNVLRQFVTVKKSGVTDAVPIRISLIEMRKFQACGESESMHEFEFDGGHFR